ncbi:MAG: hypothetical protein IPH07_18170 [Deltaproteobacteria bacterium]|nr:hypothetical protein [Deltaproteobacteria bacterium]MBP7287229.1 hypothetical protein [Nannocystaceae bacterium]
MRDSFLFGTLPLFTGCLAFLPGCTDSSGSETNADSSSGSTSTMTATSTADETGSSESSSSDVTTVSTTSPTTTAETTGDPQCGTGSCGEDAPSGWFGPTIYAQIPAGSEIPACPAEYPDPGPTLLAGFNDPPPAECTCECNLSGGAACQGFVRGHTQSNCYDYNYYNYANVSPGMCANIELDGFVNGFSFGGYPPPTCMKEANEDISPVAWDATIRSCRLPETPLVCTDGVCLPPAPEGFEAVWCIYQQGDVECPAGGFTQKQIFYTGVEDSRDCSNCSCSSVGYNSCYNEGLLQVFGGPDCAGEPVAEVPFGNGQCSAAIGSSVTVTFGDEAPCSVINPSLPEGEVATAGPFTFCCTAP